MHSQELESIRHGLKNVVTALENGCMLIESHLPSTEEPRIRGYLEEMRARLSKALALVDRLETIERSLGGTSTETGA